MADLAIATPLDVRLLAHELAADEALAAFASAHRGAGALVSFTGAVRADQGAQALELTHYEPLTLPGMKAIAKAAFARFDLAGLLAWHRVGTMSPGESIVLVAAAAPHRRDAFEAVDYVMDHLKSAAWFWKREQRGAGSDGGWRWIEPREQDRADLARWR